MPGKCTGYSGDTEPQNYKKIELKRELEGLGAFCSAWKIEHYLFLIPNQYPAIVRLDIDNDEVSYITGEKEIFVKTVEGQRRIGGSCVWKQYLLIASPVDNQILAFSMAVPYKKDILLSPYWGNMFVLLNRETGEMKEWEMPFEISYKEKSEHFFRGL